MGKVCLAWAENVLFADLGQLRCEIMDSYQITSAHDMHRIIEALREGSLPFNAVWTRTEKSLVLDHLRFCVIVAIFACVAAHTKTSAGSRPHNRIGVFMSSGVTGLYGAAKFPYF